jgi:ribosome biogenesis GTPase
VLVRPRDSDRATIVRVLERRSKLSRRSAGAALVEQVIAANLDTLFIVTAPDRDFSPRRVERYLALTWESGARPVVLLNKADLEPEVERKQRELEGVSLGVPVHAVSAQTGAGCARLEAYLSPGQTVALVGSSGVGKSSLINRLLGREHLAVATLSAASARGRHTTTTRQLVGLPGGALLIDTPGMRELQLWDAETGLARTFAELETIAAGCRYRDCRHRHEPGCAVRAAIDAGRLEPERLASYHKLERELAYLERKHNVRARLEENRRWRAIHRQQRHQRQLRNRD